MFKGLCGRDYVKGSMFKGVCLRDYVKGSMFKGVCLREYVQKLSYMLLSQSSELTLEKSLPALRTRRSLAAIDLHPRCHLRECV